MTDISALEAYAGQLSEAAALANASAETQRQIVNGDALTDVPTESGLVPTLAKQAVLAQAKVTTALVEVASQMAGAMTYTSTAAGLSGTLDGGYFSVPSPDSNEYLILYKNNAGVAAEVNRYPSATLVKDLASKVVDSSEALLAVTDPVGFAAFLVNYLGEIHSRNGISLEMEAIRNGAFALQKSTDYAFAITDLLGFVIFAVKFDGTLVTTQGAAPAGSDEVARRNTVNLARSLAVRGEVNTEIQPLAFAINMIIFYGQSWSEGMEGFPALSKMQPFDNLMWGKASRSGSGSNPTYTPVIENALSPLVAAVTAGDNVVLTDAQVAALPAPSYHRGEGPEIGCTNFLRKQFLQHFGLMADPTRRFVAATCGVGGKNVAQLSKGASPELFNRMVEAAAGVKALATAEGKSFGIPAIGYIQGEQDYGEGTVKATYKAGLKQLRSDIQTSVCGTVAGQSAPAGFFTNQSGASYTMDAEDMGIGMAQWELSKEEPNWYMAGPAYPYTDKNGHLDSNGYRWLGAQIGKVMHKVVTLRQNWKPLSPTKVTVSGTEVLIDFHVPHPPLVFDKPYVVAIATDYTDKGFRVVDAVGTISLVSVTIVADTIVKLVLSRATSGTVKVQYATRTTYLGNGCLRDSDPTVSGDKYEYTAGTGQYPEANIPALVGKPYPLHNWCIAFSLSPQ